MAKRPFVRPSVTSISAAAACGGFAAQRPAGRICRSTAAGPVLQAPALSSNGAAARRSAANAGS